MRYFKDNRDTVNEYAARLIATVVLLGLGEGAWLTWHWLAAFFK
ncbi:hypothetical protein P1X16_30850 [Hymenobacter sp. YC55]|nr:hypothetical protein [Hymenobacter sp. YC55]